MKRLRDLKRLAARVAEPFSVQMTGSDHFKVTFHGPNGDRFVIAPCSTSDKRRAHLNTLREMRAAARAVGLIGEGQ